MKRPPVVTVFGVLNLVFALGGLCVAAITTPLLTLQKGAEPADPLYAPYLEHPLFLMFTKASIVLSAFLYVLLATSGVGLLLMKGWGRSLAVVFATVTIVLSALGLALEYTIYLPAVLEHTGTMAEGPVKTGMVIGAYGGLVMGACFGLAYPIALLIFMTRAKFVALFAPPSPDAPPPAN